MTTVFIFLPRPGPEIYTCGPVTGRSGGTQLLGFPAPRASHVVPKKTGQAYDLLTVPNLNEGLPRTNLWNTPESFRQLLRHSTLRTGTRPIKGSGSGARH